MTQREFYNAVIAANLSEEITEKAKALLASVDSKNARSAKNSAEKREQNTEIGKKMVAGLTKGLIYTMDEIWKKQATVISELEKEYDFKMNSSKFTAIMRNLQNVDVVDIQKGTPNKYIVK
jgi:hypothetical protein